MEKYCRNCKFWKSKESTRNNNDKFIEEDGLLHTVNSPYGYCVESSNMREELVPESFTCPKWQGHFIFG